MTRSTSDTSSGIQRAGGFIEQHHLRLHRQGARNRHTLLLATAHMRRVAVFHAGEAYLGQVFAGCCNGFVFGHTQHVHRGFNDVLQHRHVRPQVEVLEHHGQLGAQALQLFGVFGYQFTGVGRRPAPRSSPATLMRPWWGFSNMLMQRRKVLFPEPELPMMLITSPAWADRDTPLQHFVAAEALVDVLDLEFEGLGIGHGG